MHAYIMHACIMHAYIMRPVHCLGFTESIASMHVSLSFTQIFMIYPHRLHHVVKMRFKYLFQKSESLTHGCSALVAEQGDRQLKVNTWHSVKVHVKGQTICVTCDGRAVFTDVDARTTAALSGRVCLCV